MEFFTRVLSSSSRLKERAREAEQVNQNFKANLGYVKSALESEDNSDVVALLDMVYESSFPEEQIFMKTPSRARLMSKKELLVRLLIGLDSLGVPAMVEMLVFIRKHGPEEIADSLMTLLDCLSPLLEGKEAPEFSTDDLMDAMDSEWHSTSRMGSPLFNAIASATSSPRASAASVADSPLHPILPASPYRRAISDRSMLVSRGHELHAKLIRDKISPASTPPQPSLTTTTSLQFPSANQESSMSQPAIIETPASPEITEVSIGEKPSSYSLDTVPASSQHGSQRIHRRKSSSLQQLFAEDVNDWLSMDGSVGASSRRNSSSSSLRRNSSELKKIITNTSEISSPMSPGLGAGEGVSVTQDEEFLSRGQFQDGEVDWPHQKGSQRILPTPLPDEVTLWRHDSGGVSVDLISSHKSAHQATVPSPIHSESSEDIHHRLAGHAKGMGASSKVDDSIMPSMSNTLEQEMNILPVCDSDSLSSKNFGKSVSTVSQPPQHIQLNGGTVPGDDLLEAEERTNKSVLDEEEPNECADDVNPTKEPHDYSKQEANKLVMNDDLVTTHSNENGGVNVHSVSGNEQEMKMEPIEATHEASSHDGSNGGALNAHSILDGANVGHELIKAEEVDTGSSSDTENMSAEHIPGREAKFQDHTYSSSGSDEHDRSSNASKLVVQEQVHDDNQLVKDQLDRMASEITLDDSLQMKQSNAFRRRHHRSHSDLILAKSLGKAASPRLEKTSGPHRSGSDGHAKMEKLRRKFARHLRSLTASMEGFRRRGSSVDRAVKVESMHWMDVDIENIDHQRELKAREENGEGLDLDASTDESTSSGTSGCPKAPHTDERSLALHNLDAELHVVDDDGALKKHGHMLGWQSHSDGKSQEGARQAQSPEDHKEDTEHVLSSSDNSNQDGGHSYPLDTHKVSDAEHVHSSQEDAVCPPRHTFHDCSQDARDAHSLETPEEDAGHAFTHVQHSPDEADAHSSTPDFDKHAIHGHSHAEDAGDVHVIDQDKQDGFENASDKITPEGDNQEGHGFQSILAPLLLPSSDDIVSEDVGDQASGTASLSLEDKRNSDSFGDPGSVEREDKGLHTALSPHEDLQTAQEAGDTKPSCPVMQEQGQVINCHDFSRDVPVPLCETDITDDTSFPYTHSLHEVPTEVTDIHLCVSPDASATSSHADVRPTMGANDELSDDQHPLHQVKTNEHLQAPSSVDAVSLQSTALADCADNNGTHQVPSSLEPSSMCEEVHVEETLQNNDCEALMHKAPEWKDDTFDAYKNSLDKQGSFSLDKDPVDRISPNEDIKLEVAELNREDDEKEDSVLPVDVHAEGVSGTPSVEEHLKVGDDQFEKLLSEVHDVEDGISSGDREVLSTSDNEQGQIVMDDDKATEKIQQEDSSSRPDKETMQLYDEKVGTVDENTTLKEDLKGDFVDNIGQFRMDGSRHIPALAEYDNCNHMQDHGQANEASPNLQGADDQSNPNSRGAEPSFKQQIKPRDLDEVNPVHEQENRKLDQGKQYRLEHPTTVEAAAQDPNMALFAVDNTADGDNMHAGLMASLKDHEHQQAENLSHVSSSSTKTDTPAAEDPPLHGHPTYESTPSHADSQLQSGQHILDESATFSDSTWDANTNMPKSRSKRKGDSMGKLARGCLPCCAKPHTNP